jgi:hypothetical protein
VTLGKFCSRADICGSEKDLPAAFLTRTPHRQTLANVTLNVTLDGRFGKRWVEEAGGKVPVKWANSGLL